MPITCSCRPHGPAEFARVVVVSEFKTRVVHLEGGQHRDNHENPETRVLMLDALATQARFRRLFLMHYESLRRRSLAFGQLGLAIAAVELSSKKMAGMICLAAKPDVANSAIVGRHSMTDLYLDGDASLSLRHLAVILAPLSNIDEVRFRVLDLRTQTSFYDENDNKLEALVAEGPLFLRCGGYALFFLLTGDATSWPESADDAWAMIPERVYLEATEAEPDRWKRRRPPRRRTHHEGRKGHERKETQSDNDKAMTATKVQGVRGPIRAHARLVGNDESPLGSLRIRTESGSESMPMGQQAARRGILLGRYERCDVDGSRLLTSDNISRVHLLVVDVSGRLYAIDTASTNGTWRTDEDHEVRVMPLDLGVELSLGNDLVYLRWQPAM